MTQLPYFTDFPGIGGKIKSRPEHVYCEIQKIRMTTFEAIERIARRLDVSTRDIGYAGMKDAQAISRQVLSIQGTTEDAVMALDIPDLSILWARRHGNKLRLGHLRANRFAIKIRDVDPAAVVRVRPVLEELERRGMPNYFGEQRFGRRHNNDLLGAALVRGDNEGVLKLLLGSPDPSLDDPRTRAAREAFDQRKNEDAMRIWPRAGGMERRVLQRLIKTGKPGAAVRAIDEKLRRLWVSALQSRIFNEVLARRITSIDRVMTGDMAYKHENGACFRVEDANAEQPRAAAFEISPTGPIIGYRMTEATDEPGRIEQEVLAAHGLEPSHFRAEGRLKVKGSRRPLRVRPENVELAAGVDEHGPHITVAFTLPAGAFATVLMREIMRNAKE
jgi:tRNA pseudouridine13 synthase